MPKTRTPHVYSYQKKDGSTLYYVTFYCKQWDGTNKKIKKMGSMRQDHAATATTGKDSPMCCHIVVMLPSHLRLSGHALARAAR